jgi:hypothetical protein
VLTDVAVQWATSAPEVATITADGRLSAVRAGTVNVTGIVAGTGDSVQASRTVRIDLHPAASMELSMGDVVLPAKEGRVQVSALVYGLDGRMLRDRHVTWTAADPGVARVTATGEITAVAAGLTRVTARCGAVSATMQVRVTSADSLYVYRVALVNGLRLPAVLDDQIEEHPTGPMRVITKLQQGTYRVDAGYAVQLQLTTYERIEFYGGWFDREIGRTSITDAGSVWYDWETGDATLHSTRIGGLTHTLRIEDGVPVLRFRVAGSDTIWRLQLERTP